jgi:hypothetical protein
MYRTAHRVVACAALLLAVAARAATAQQGKARTPDGVPRPPGDSMPVYRPDKTRITPMPRLRVPDRPPLDSTRPRAPRGAVLPRDDMPTLRPDTSRFRMPRLVPPPGKRALPPDSLVGPQRN